jgi:hypothetical protein
VGHGDLVPYDLNLVLERVAHEEDAYLGIVEDEFQLRWDEAEVDGDPDHARLRRGETYLEHLDIIAAQHGDLVACGKPQFLSESRTMHRLLKYPVRSCFLRRPERLSGYRRRIEWIDRL